MKTEYFTNHNHKRIVRVGCFVGVRLTFKIRRDAMMMTVHGADGQQRAHGWKKIRRSEDHIIPTDPATQQDHNVRHELAQLEFCKLKNYTGNRKITSACGITVTIFAY